MDDILTFFEEAERRFVEVDCYFYCIFRLNFCFNPIISLLGVIIINYHLNMNYNAGVE